MRIESLLIVRSKPMRIPGMRRSNSLTAVVDAFKAHALGLQELQRALGPRLGSHLWRHLHAGEVTPED